MANYRPAWWPDDGRSVVQRAVDIHSTLNGSMERPEHEQRKDVDCLRWLLFNWKEPTSAFDNAVHYLCEGAMAEYDEQMGTKNGLESIS